MYPYESGKQYNIYLFLHVIIKEIKFYGSTGYAELFDVPFAVTICCG